MKKAKAKKSTSKAASNRKPAAKGNQRTASKRPASKLAASGKPKQAAKSKAPAKAAAKVAAKRGSASKPARTPSTKPVKATAPTKTAAKPTSGRASSTAARKAAASATLRQAVPKRSNAPVTRSAGARAKAAPADTRSTEGLDGALAALKLALEKKAVEPTLLDLRDLCSYTNYRLLLSGRSDRQVDAIADGVVAGLRDAGVRHLSKERTDARAWTLIDFGDFIVDVFHHPSREHYDLESLWNDAPRVAIEIPPDARLGAAEAYA